MPWQIAHTVTPYHRVAALKPPWARFPTVFMRPCLSCSGQNSCGFHHMCAPSQLLRLLRGQVASLRFLGCRTQSPMVR